MREWCEFLGSKVGSAEAAQKIIMATDLHATAYRTWLEAQPGERPRGTRGVRENRNDVAIRDQALNAKKTGLESTQSNATIHKKFAALRRMYRVLVAQDLGVTINPFDSDRMPPPSKEAGRKRPTEMIDFGLVSEIVSSPDPSTSKGIRDRAILALLFGGGLRRSEIVGLRIGDVRRTPSGTTFLYLRNTKARRDAEQAVPPWAAQLLDAHLSQRRTEQVGELDHLFVGYTGQGGRVPSHKPISDTGVYHLFRHYCLAVGSGPYVTPHSARATAITKLLSDGIPHREVQEFSRHSSIQMVELYDKRRFGVDSSPAKGLSYEKIDTLRGKKGS